MEDLQLTLTPSRVDQRNFGVMLSNWRVGQVLNALVVDTRPDNGVLLSVGGKQFVATTDLPVQPGTNMTLEVKQMGREVILRQVADNQPLRADAAARAADNTLALTSARPSALLNQLAAQPARFGSPELQEVARELLGRALKGDSVKPGDMRRAVRESGLFTEADLASGNSQQAQKSSKPQLSQLQTLALALADDLEEASAEARVLRQVAEKAGSLLGGIAHNQLASIAPDESSARWVVTLPVQLQQQFHDVRVQIDRERSGNSAEGEDVWRATLNLDLPQLGAVQIRVQMARNSISVNFSCDEAVSSRMLERSMDRLEQRLIQRELNVDRLKTEVRAETPARPASDSGLSIEA